MNSYDSLVLFSGSLSNENQFYILKGGLSQLINKMKQEFITCGGKIKLNYELKNINYVNKIFSCEFLNLQDYSLNVYESYKLILACDGLNIQKK